ncbi:hypothetical protein RIT80_11325, partial [Streptococcus pneumoniae]|nr:hypothetical protein [Streptococcus pneumoniae]
KFSPEMMVMAKGVNVGISTIYYWIHHGKLGLSKQDLLYPRKGKALKKQASTNFKPAGQSAASGNSANCLMRRLRVLSGLQIPAPSVGRIRRLRRIRQQCQLPDATLARLIRPTNSRTL